jgi:hypothetical protein
MWFFPKERFREFKKIHGITRSLGKRQTLQKTSTGSIPLSTNIAARNAGNTKNQMNHWIDYY